MRTTVKKNADLRHALDLAIILLATNSVYESLDGKTTGMVGANIS